MGGRKGNYGSKNKKVVGLSGVPIPARARRQTVGNGGGGGGTYNPINLNAEGHIMNASGLTSGHHAITHLVNRLHANGITTVQGEASAMLDGISKFSGHYYSDIRSYQRDPAKYASKNSQSEVDKIKSYADALENYISKAPKWNGGESYRGIEFNYETDRQRFLDDFIKASANGGYSEGAISSWSSNRRVSESFAGSSHHPVLIVHERGNRKTISSIRPYSQFSGEDEMIATSRARYKYLRHDKSSSGELRIYVDEMD